MFNSYWDSQEQQATGSWYPPSVVVSTSTLFPATSTAGSSSSTSITHPENRPNSSPNVSPAEAAVIIATLKDKSNDELKKFLSDKDAYQNLLLSLEPVKTQNRVRDELRNETLHLARKNLEKEPVILELRNQCRIIQTTELATAQEMLHELERKKEENLKCYSPASLVHQLQEAMNKTEAESETLHKQLLDSEIDLAAFVQKYKKSRHAFHKRALTHLAAKTSLRS